MRPELEAKINRILLERLNGPTKMMNLDDFADFFVWENGDITEIIIRHNKESCNYWQTKIEGHPNFGANLKYLMVRATAHWQEDHQNEG